MFSTALHRFLERPDPFDLVDGDEVGERDPTRLAQLLARSILPRDS